MTAARIAWTAIAALFATALLIDLWRRWYRYWMPHRFGTVVSTSEWRALMREADMDLKPPVRRYEGAPGVSITVRPPKQAKVQTIDKVQRGRNAANR
jgi:hypothetical protein